MEDSPRYRIISISTEHVAEDLQRALRPGDRVVSVFPVRAEPVRYPEFSSTTSGGVMLNALLELRHPSWIAEGVGWTCSW
jgi:hypothetical protein